ncbi:peptidoglycan recognition protein family protein [Nocardiopsis dassonvillei]|uniref:peptidoglycan recognition protein family protein n=1 Tax=Nocardiopsis dassonvillei TaxID=2014 RepID=UPI0020A3D4D6|nr:peptidoglycan recognition family protein [Nocardiopsis dassonvillei]MCP3013120.1 peptidoglycan recognition protein family protein [Nocardiopsis dassonvillei]
MTNTHGSGPDRRSILRAATIASATAALGAVGATSAFARPADTSAAVQAAQPYLYWRGAWGARPPSSPIQVLAAAPRYIVVHHTATPNSTNYSLDHALNLSRSIQNHHMDTNGWSDTGQQLTISRGGYVMEGRDRTPEAIAAGNHVVGAHVANNNNTCIGIENEGLYTSVGPTAALTDALVQTLAWLCGAYGLNPHSAILGHRDFNATACPGDVLYSRLPELRDRAAQTMRTLGIAIAARREPGEDGPTYPPVPDDEPEREFYHGPARGPDDFSR